MTAERLFTPRNPWFTASVGFVALVAVLAALAGFVWFPLLDRHATFDTLWSAICTAAGVPRAVPAGHDVAPKVILSSVVLKPAMLRDPGALSIGRGATLSLRCAMCHGARGLSQADSPNLAGQYAAVTFKELHDFKSGARTNAVMTPMVANLSDQDIRDLAAYYAYLPRLPGYHPGGPATAPRIVATGAPMRNIPPCAACHGGLDNKVGSPWLEGQPASYLTAQLQAFASGARHNDISEQMRNIARHMTPQEIAEAASWYASQPPAR